MKLSSISLVAAALAAIAGSVIAASGPLHARASEAINSFGGRDVVDLFTRQPLRAAPARARRPRRPRRHRRPRAPPEQRLAEAAAIHKQAGKSWFDAAEKAQRLYHVTDHPDAEKEATKGWTKYNDHFETAKKHRDARAAFRAGNPSPADEQLANHALRSKDSAVASNALAQLRNVVMDCHLHRYGIDMNREAAERRAH